LRILKLILNGNLLIGLMRFEVTTSQKCGTFYSKYYVRLWKKDTAEGYNITAE